MLTEPVDENGDPRERYEGETNADLMRSLIPLYVGMARPLGDAVSPAAKPKPKPKPKADGKKNKNKKPKKKAQYDGAYVSKPEVGFYNDPVIVLDFNSLYPSIIDHGNYCCSTWVPSLEYAAAQGLSEDDLTLAPTGYYFVKRTVQEGILRPPNYTFP